MTGDLLCFYLIILGFMTLFFAGALRIRDNSIVDIAWGLGVVLCTVISLPVFGAVYPRKILISTMACLWGLRLAIYITLRKKGRGEDYRYQSFRKRWTKYFKLKSLLYIFWFQGTLQLLLVLPVLLVNRSGRTGWTPFDALGLLLFIIGFAVESAADWQMYRFKKYHQNRGRLMTEGIWKYSRHPNYFGETTLWWGIALLALPVKGGAFALASPVMVTLLLLFFSGIPLLEKKYRDRPDFQEYKAETSLFFPWFKKKPSRL